MERPNIREDCAGPVFTDMEREAAILLGHGFLESERIDRALQIFEGLAEYVPGDPYIRKTLAYIYLRLKRYEEALRWIKRFLAMDGIPRRERLPAAFLEAYAYWGLKKEDEYRTALKEYYRLLETTEDVFC